MSGTYQLLLPAVIILVFRENGYIFLNCSQMPIIIKRNKTIKSLKERIKSKFGSKFIITDEELNNKSVFSSFLRRLKEIEPEEIKFFPDIITDEFIADFKERKKKDAKEKAKKYDEGRSEKRKNDYKANKNARLKEEIFVKEQQARGELPGKGTFSKEEIAEIISTI